MTRPCFLVIDREFAGTISTRKLVIETAKFNVITAYSGGEAVETLRRFPAVSGVVLDAGVKDMPCQTLVDTLKSIVPSVRIIMVSTMNEPRCDGVDHHLESFAPTRILALLKDLEPEQAAAIQRHDEALAERQ